MAESSFDAWTKFYKQDENAPNAIVSYYTKGALVALGLDIQLRDATDERVTLDHLMRELWLRHGKPDIGVPEDGIERLATELAGTDLSDFFDRYVHGTDELPLEDWLPSLGVGIQQRPAADAVDQGKSSKTAPESVEAKPVLGARWTVENGFARLSHVLDGGAAQAAGSAGAQSASLATPSPSQSSAGSSTQSIRTVRRRPSSIKQRPFSRIASNCRPRATPVTC